MKSFFMLAVATSAIVVANPAWAQITSDPTSTPPPNVSTPKSSSTDADEIVVTAQKRQTRAVDTPVSVTAVGRAELTERGAVNIKDILSSIPGLAYNGNDSGQSNYNIRGLSSTSSSPTVGIYLDDVSLVTQGSDFSGAFDLVFFDIERLEVLKGPQGTLYGGSAMGGAIKYVSAKPDLENKSLNLTAGGAGTAHGAGSYDAQAIANVPIVQDHLALRIGGYYKHVGGYIDNVPGLPVVNPEVSSTAEPTITPVQRASLSTLSEKNDNYQDIYVARASVLWKPDPSWSIRPQVIYQDTYLNADPYIFLDRGEALTSSYRLPAHRSDIGTISSLQVDKELGPVQITSLTSYFDRHQDFSRDYSFEIARLTGGATGDSALYGDNSLAVYPTYTRTFSQELRIGSSASSHSHLTWLAGLYYSDQNQDYHQDVYTTDPNEPGVQIFPDNNSYHNLAISNLSQYAAFGEATYHITSRLGLTAGVRLFRITEREHEVLSGALAGGSSTTEGGSKENGVNPKFGVDYKLTQDNLLYANAAKGFRPGGLNFGFPDTDVCRNDLAANGLTGSPGQYKSDSVWTYEAGTKNDFHGVFTINAAAFYSKWDNIQQYVFLDNCGFGFTANFGTAEIKGAELEASVKPFPGLKLGTALTFTDSEITQVAPGTTAKVGDSIQYVPKYLAGVYADYNVPLNATWRLVARADYQYRSKQRYDYMPDRSVLFPDGTSESVPNEAHFQEGYSTVSLAISLEHGPTNFRFYIDNLTDARPLSTVIEAFPARAETIQPRTVGLEVRQAF